MVRLAAHLLAALAGAALLAAATPAAAADSLRLVNANTLGRPGASPKYLAVSGASRYDGAAAILWTDLGQRDIRWRLEPVSGLPGTHRLRNLNSGRPLATLGGGTRPGARAVQWQSRDPRASAWRLRPAPARPGVGPCFRIEQAASGLVLAVAGASRENGARVILWHDRGQADAVWCIAR